LFPDANLAANLNKKFPPKISSFAKPEPDFEEKNTEHYQKFIRKLNLIKSSSLDCSSGLLNRLACCMALVNQIGQTKAIAQLWREFVLELRFRYDSSVFITGLETSSTSNNRSAQNLSDAISAPLPDLSRCILHQKIQMLNCCIKKRVERQQFELDQYKAQQQTNDQEDDEETFFDCEEDTRDDNDEAYNSLSNISSENFKPDGRLKKFADLTLLNKPSEPLYFPITQVNEFFTF
jgi:Rab3 GTPase-activating protein catalytic subunit